MKYILSSLTLLFCFVNTYAQHTPKYSPEQLKKDLAFYKESIEKYNPALGFFHPRESFDSTYSKIYSELNDSMSVMEFFPYLTRLCAAQKEGHAWVGAFADTTNLIYHGFMSNQFKFLPISVALIDGKLFVKGNLSANAAIEQGDEIISINGKSVPDLITQLKAYTIEDGDIESARLFKIGRTFATMHYWFIEQPSHYQLQIKPRNVKSEEIKTVTVAAITREKMVMESYARYGIPDTPEPSIDDVYTFKIEGDIATLTLKTFDFRLMNRYKIKPDKLFKKLFKKNEKSRCELPHY